MNPLNHRCLYTSQTPPNLSIKPNYPFSPSQPSVADKSKQNHAYLFHDSCCCCFHSCFCLSFSIPSKSFYFLLVEVFLTGATGTLNLWCSLLYRLIKMPGCYQCTLLCFLLVRLQLVTWHKAKEGESGPMSKCVLL